MTVKDTDLGLANMPTNLTVNATSPQGAVVTYTSPTVVDEESPLPTASCAPGLLIADVTTFLDSSLLPFFGFPSELPSLI